MPLETVRIRVVQDNLAQDPVAGVAVRVFDAAGTVLETFGTTDASGIVDFTLNGDAAPVTYQVRCYKQGVGFGAPQLIEVYSPAAAAPNGTNDFSIEGSVPELPVASDPLLCRVSGVIRRADGRPQPGVDLHFIPEFRPSVVGGALVVGERVVTRSDKNGEAVIDLYRNGIYLLTMEGHEHATLRVIVPDRSSVALGDLVLPQIARVDWDPAGPWALLVGEELDVVPTVTTSSYVELQALGGTDVKYESLDPDVLAVTRRDDRLTLRGVSAGNTQLKVEANGSLVHVPQLAIVNGLIDVTVS